ncbi:hypothetical protein HGA92_00365 [Candidatus Gracilibacteria bacterium]|nr:hypothetical protein [Candidatus Gracilibacteria bacterium]NUJ98935.1 hypothetical protein [Candidatus Gracilibacteria bacterium]
MNGNINFEQFTNDISYEIFSRLEYYTPKVFFALIILLFGIIISITIYKMTLYLFEKFKIGDFINKIDMSPLKKEEELKEGATTKKVKRIKKINITEKLELDKIVGKSFAYYIFLVFFRFSIIAIGVTEIENFLSDVLNYLPSLFIGIVIGFFGIRFADTVYDVIFHALQIAKQKTGKVIAMLAKIIILFFTTMLVLHYIKIVDQFIINTFIIGFVGSISLACAIAFGLGGREVAHEILESFKK